MIAVVWCAPRSVVLAALLLTTAACTTTSPCTSGTDVRDLTDDGISQATKDEVFASGAVIGKDNADYPSGKLVIIRTAFPDWPQNSAVTKTYLDSVFFDDTPSTSTIRGYYRVNSWDDFHVSEGDVPPWIEVSKKLTDYANGIEDNAPFTREVLKLAEVDWSSLDKNNDHEISRAEAQILILPSNAMPDSGFASVRDPDVGSVQTPDGTYDFGRRNILIFSVKAAADPNHANNPIRSLQAVAHELGHAFFNLPDRYGPTTGTGNYDIMSTTYTWTLFTMPDRMKIGWIKPKLRVAHKSKCYEFAPSETKKAALVLVPPDEMRAPTGVLEYWVIEYRKTDEGEGYDAALPDEGLAVWYVAEGTYSDGFEDVRLVDASAKDKDPDKYDNPGNNALFRKNNNNQRRELIDRTNNWTLLWFQRVSDKGGAKMWAEF